MQAPTMNERISIPAKLRAFVLPLLLIAAGSFAVQFFLTAQDSYNGILLFGSNQYAGDIKKGQTLHYTIEAFNCSLFPVSTDSFPSCGCTVAGAYQHTIYPFTRVSIPFEISSGGLAMGQHSKSVSLKFKSRDTNWLRVASVGFNIR